MRLLINLKLKRTCSYDFKYYNKMQGLIYNLLKRTPYEILHNKKGYKFFCFSNIFPISNMDVESKKQFIISSPDKYFINIVKERLNELSEINLGEYMFSVEKISVIKNKLNKKCKIISATPIIIRIPEKHYEKYCIPQRFRKKRYCYWRPPCSFNAFINQIEENLIKKYNEFNKEKLDISEIFEMFKYKKSVVNHVVINGIEQKFIGSVWEFMFNYLNKEQKRILEFGLDCGLGERNSFGFGFVNVVK